MTTDPLSQEPFQCRFEWGTTGVCRAVSRGDVIVIVDTLSFSTTTVVGVSRGAHVFPCLNCEEAHNLSRRVGAELAVNRAHVPARGKFSLSPFTFLTASPDERIVLPSPNGAACSKMADGSKFVFCAALVNASATARAVENLLRADGAKVTVVACGELEQGSIDTRRFAIEDLLAAGAVIEKINASRSPEACVAATSYCYCSADLAPLILDSASGRELRFAGFDDDVQFSCQIDLLDTVACLSDGRYRRYLG